MIRWKPYFPFMLALLLALALKLILLFAGAVPFNSDEAIVALTARHILQGARPVFFYGQAYMGTIDSYMIALGFSIFGESVLVMRLIELALYLLYLVSLWGLARRLFAEVRIANLAVIVAAIPPVLVSTYTTVYYGTYGETILLGNIILLLGYEVVYGNWQISSMAWSVLGAIAGLAFWTFGLIGVYILPVALLGLWKHRATPWKYYLLCGLGFLLGSGPLWLYNLQNDWVALTALTGPNYITSTLSTRFLNLLLFNFPALIGLRFPWRPEYVAWPLAALTLVLYLVVFTNVVVDLRHKKISFSIGAGALLTAFVIIFMLAFVGSGFSIDVSGRYLLPLFAPLVFVIAILVSKIWSYNPNYAMGLLSLFLALNLAATLSAAASPDGLTTQFDPISSFDNKQDQALIDFLIQEDLSSGYSNYWVTYRLAFLSKETLIFSPELPYKLDLSYTNEDIRIPEYAELADQSAESTLITTQHPQLDDFLRERLSRMDVGYLEKQIGPYHIFYDLSAKVTPGELGFGN